MALLNYLILFVFCCAVQGQENSEEAPYAVAMVSTDGYQHCTGSILNKEWVLMNAMCLHGYDTLWPIDSHVITTGPDYTKPLSVHEITKQIIHEKYDPSLLFSHEDIALVKVTPPFEFTESIRSVKLPEPDLKIAQGTTAILAQWGQRIGTNDDIVKKIPLGIIDNNECEVRHESLMAFYDKQIEDTEICTAPTSPEHAKGHCLYSTGGPLTIDDGTIVGINSYSGNCGEKPDVFTRVSEFIDWIAKNIQ